jgi:hypothetical protein
MSPSTYASLGSRKRVVSLVEVTSFDSLTCCVSTGFSGVLSDEGREVDDGSAGFSGVFSDEGREADDGSVGFSGVFSDEGCDGCFRQFVARSAALGSFVGGREGLGTQLDCSTLQRQTMKCV